MAKLFIAVAILALTAVNAAAQDPTHVDFQVFRQATPPVSASAIYSIPLTAFDCTQPRTTDTPTNVVNPRTYRFNDWRNTTDCVHTEAVGGPLTLLPFDQITNYFVRGSLRNIVANGPTADSNPFRRPGQAPTAFPANLRVGPSQ